jgi:AcrR family transcriptional regulator
MVRIVKDPLERRKEIIAAAGRLFLTRGYDRTTMRHVMVELNIAKGTIYHYFRSKEELLDAVIAEVVNEEMLRQERFFRTTEGTAIERIRQFVIAGSSHQDGHKELLEHLHKPANAGMHIRLLAQLVTRQAPLFADLISQGCDEGVFSTEKPLDCAEFMLAGVQFLTDVGIYPWEQQQLQRRWLSFPSLLESLLNAPPGSFSFLLELNEAKAVHPECHEQLDN